MLFAHISNFAGPTTHSKDLALIRAQYSSFNLVLPRPLILRKMAIKQIDNVIANVNIMHACQE